MLYRLLTAIPWGKGQPPDWRSLDGQPLGGALMDALWEDTPSADSGALQSALGAIMDSTVAKPHRLRPLARFWARWAAEQVRHLASAWVRATDPGAPCPLQKDCWATEYEVEPGWKKARQNQRQPSEDDLRSEDEVSADSNITSDNESDYEGSTDSSEVISSSDDSSYSSDPWD
jgi:hypothetical protein